jgi:hypothetical protein
MEFKLDFDLGKVEVCLEMGLDLSRLKTCLQFELDLEGGRVET